MNSIRDAYQILQANASSEVFTNLRQSITPLALAGNLSNEVAPSIWNRTANFFSMTGKAFLFFTNAALLEKSYGILKENYALIQLNSDYQHKLFLAAKAAGQFLETFLPVFDVTYSLANRYIVNIPFLGVILDGAKVLYAISPGVLAVSDGEKEVDRALRQFCELASKDFSGDPLKNERDL
ncbi:MAG: hypothetical protein HKM07_05970, partial [Chlamydiae bacterium]|nr:hypothetical protein [Chlamydiota bacterium]